MKNIFLAQIRLWWEWEGVLTPKTPLCECILQFSVNVIHTDLGART